jgi:hypothetical protein
MQTSPDSNAACDIRIYDVLNKGTVSPRSAKLTVVRDLGDACCSGLLSTLPLHWWAVSSLAAGAWWDLDWGFARPLTCMPAGGRLTFVVLVSWSSAAGDGFSLVSVRMAFGAWLVLACAAGGRCFFSDPVGL